MTVRVSTTILTQLHSSALTIEWTALALNDTGSWELLGHYNDKCLHVWGIFGGAIVTIEGSNENVPANPVSLTDPTQTLISINGTAIKQILENPLFVRPKITGGDGTTSLSARLVCRT